MPQYTNLYNSQNGAYSGQSMSQQNSPMMPPNQSWAQQGWKPYAPEPTPQPIPVQGRYVNSFEEIKPNEVPMDGNLYFFPKPDGSEIYVKVWSRDGNLMAYRFLPEKVEPSKPTVDNSSTELVQQTLQNFGNVIDQRLLAFESRINDILAPFMSQSVPDAKPSASDSVPKVSRKVKEGV